MIFFNYIFSLPITSFFGVLIKHLGRKKQLLNQLTVSQMLFFIFMIIVDFNIMPRETSIIFKGQAVKLEKTPGLNGYPELHGKINGKEIIATTDKSPRKKNNHYLGAFRKLDNKHNKSGKKKLVLYHVFEKK